MAVKKLIDGSGVKAVVSHQHRYGPHYTKVAEIARSGALGNVHTIYASAPGWMMHMASHMIDYMREYNGWAEAEWVMAQAAGDEEGLDVNVDLIFGTPGESEPSWHSSVSGVLDAGVDRAVSPSDFD